MNFKIIIVSLGLFIITACSTTSQSITSTNPNWTREPKTLYSDYTCGQDHKRWLEYHNFKTIDSYGYSGVLTKYLVSKKEEYYIIEFADIKDIGDYEIEDNE